MKRLLLTLFVILLFGISVYTVVNYNKENNDNSNNKNYTFQNSNEENTSKPVKLFTKVKATDFKLQDLNGKEVFLSDFKGKQVLLNFWATWCPPCKAEMPDIEKLYQETKNSNFVILAVNLGEDKQAVKSFIDKNKYNFVVLLDTNQDVALKYNVASIPTSLFIDKDGYIVSKKIGAMSIEELKSTINSID